MRFTIDFGPSLTLCAKFIDSFSALRIQTSWKMGMVGESLMPINNHCHDTPDTHAMRFAWMSLLICVMWINLKEESFEPFHKSFGDFFFSFFLSKTIKKFFCLFSCFIGEIFVEKSYRLPIYAALCAITLIFSFNILFKSWKE